VLSNKLDDSDEMFKYASHHIAGILLSSEVDM